MQNYKRAVAHNQYIIIENIDSSIALVKNNEFITNSDDILRELHKINNPNSNIEFSRVSVAVSMADCNHNHLQSIVKTNNALGNSLIDYFYLDYFYHERTTFERLQLALFDLSEKEANTTNAQCTRLMLELISAIEYGEIST